MKRSLLKIGALALALLTTAACGSSANTGSGPATVTVWLMRDSLSQPLIDEFKTTYESAHPDTRLDIQIQEWNGISQKIVGALASNDAPDVVEVGNTQVTQYAGSGGITDLTDKTADLKGADWIPGLRDPGNVDGKQFGIPFYAANRVVIYNKDLFAAAGITTPPKTRDEWIADTRKLDTGKNQGIFLPGQNWFVLSGFIWDEGGDLAMSQGGAWQGGLATPQAQAGMAFYKQLQALGNAPKDSDEAKSQQNDVFARGDIAQLIASPGAAELITKANPALTGKLGFFPIPGKTADKPGAVLTGGSNLIIPVATTHPDQAYDVLKALTGEQWQVKIDTTMSYVPNRTGLAAQVTANPGTAAMALGAANGHGTPKSPNWAAVEAQNPIKDYLTKVLVGGNPADAAKAADDVIATALNTAK
jgi:N,N'-diacetylchitobiose transport system substrate-binding protein